MPEGRSWNIVENELALLITKLKTLGFSICANRDITFFSVLRAFFSFKLPYRLHAVLVHEGQASGGHYWAYIQDPSQQRWCKFNDITVSEVTWEEVSRESLGSYRNVSAYCLMYIDARREGCIGAGGSIHELPLDLKELVDKDNAEFENEMRDWDEKQLAKTGKSGDSICPFWLYKKKKATRSKGTT